MLAGAGCDAGSRDNDGAAPPSVRLLSVSGLDESGGLVVISPGGKSVVRNTTLHLKFDRFLLPTSAIRQAICLQPHEAATVEGCLEPVSFSVAYDPAAAETPQGPVAPEVIYRLQTDQNGGNVGLVGDDYVLTVFQATATDPTSVGFRAFDGAILDKRYAIDISVSNKMAPAGSDGPPTAAGAWCDTMANDSNGAATVLTGNCGVTGCHINKELGDGSILPAAMGLQFANGDRTKISEVISRTAINHVAHETQIGEHADQGEAAPDRFGRAMPIVDAQSAGNSYILYKLLIGQDTATHVPFIADADERQRLRDAFVVDDPMPLPAGSNRVQMQAAWIATLSAWIQAGAGTPSCP